MSSFSRTIYTTLFTILYVALSAQNPITPTGMYIADPEAHVWDDGKIYLYGSRDESDDYWCSYSHNVLFSSDLIHWDVVEQAFASKGDHDEVSAHDELLFAPDCSYKDDTYYLYFCSPGKPKLEGVATSSSPLGPFTNGKIIEHAQGIDPAVFIDDDGQGYYAWGQGKPQMAKLNPDMCSIDTSSIVYPLDKAGNVAFHEGSSLRKIGKSYYFIFADDSRNNRPTCLGYATSNTPMGPYTYRGVIIDNVGSDPQNWNNHGSIEQFEGQWYVFYHRPTNNSRKFRKACIEPITINKDGSIDEVEMTTQGALGKAIPATEVIQAERACYLSGELYIAPLSSQDTPQEGLHNIHDGDYAAYKYLAFDKNIQQFTIKTQGHNSGSITLRLDSPQGTIIGQCPISKSKNYRITQCKITPTKGKHTLFLVFEGQEEPICDVDWFYFEQD